VAVQEHHDLADDFLVCPAGDDLASAFLPDAGHLAQTLWRALDDVEHRHAEGLDEAARIDRADALDHAGAEVALDAGARGGRRHLHEDGAELPPMLAVGDPVPARARVFAGCHARGVPDERDQVAFALDLQAQDAKAVVRVVEGDALDQAVEVIQRSRGCGAVVLSRAGRACRQSRS